MRTIKATALLSIFLTGMISPAYAYNCDSWVAKLQSTQGSVQVRQKNRQWLNVELNSTFCKGDVLRVQENSRAALLLRNDTILRLSENSTITFTNLSADKPSIVSIDEGIGHFISRVKASFEVITPFLNAAIEGTEFVVSVNNDQAEVTVFEGKVRAYNNLGEVQLGKNQTAQAKDGHAPILILKATPRDAVNWSLYYPLIIEPNKTSALNEASLQLQTGQIASAKNLLQKMPNNSDALALQAIINIVQNNKSAGLKLANQALSINSKNATAKLALSYALQAHFDVTEALQVLEQATQESPDNALVWSRLAEVYLMHGELNKALNAAKKANQLNPELSRTSSVLGFAYLTRIEIKQAIAAFKAAIKKDQTNPLARLGLGLAIIRQGDLASGRRELEYAATLDPNNALIRSYLGKAYYEEKRNKLAAVQFAMAKSLDPNDPSAYYYDAIRKQSENNPIEALADLQTAIKLNDNKAVYRSRLLLDQDSAARSTNQAKIYRSLGFEKRALIEGWNSLKTDPNNYSAHRFLAETYASQPRHEIARVSELFQATMLQQVNRAPVSPLLGDVSLDVQQGTGPNQTSFNDYNNLFTQNGDYFSGSSVLGNNNTSGTELIMGVLEKNISASAGIYKYKDDGFRKNNQLDKSIINILFQNQITQSTKLVLDFQSKHRQIGDRELRFFKTDFSQVKKTNLELNGLTLGATHQISTNQKIIATVSTVSEEFTTTDKVSGFFNLNDKSNTDVLTTEINYLFHSNYVDVKAGYLTANGDTSKRLTIQFISDTFTTGDIKNDTAYVYTDLKWPEHVTWTLGVSQTNLTDFSNISFERSQYNPKLGFNWDITNSLSFRAAKFRTIKRRLLTDKSLEPTLIAGFNQFYDDINASNAKVETAAFDAKLTTKVFTGVEWLKRELDVPYYRSSTKEILETEWNEHILKIYFYWVINSQWSSSIDYLYERFNRNEIFPREFQISNTKRLPIKLTYTINKNITSSLTAMGVQQNGIYKNNTTSKTSEGKGDFWVYDFNLSYKINRDTNVGLFIKNILDEDFQYQETDFNNPSIIPDRTYYLQATYQF